MYRDEEAQKSNDPPKELIVRARACVVEGMGLLVRVQGELDVRSEVE